MINEPIEGPILFKIGFRSRSEFNCILLTARKKTIILPIHHLQNCGPADRVTVGRENIVPNSELRKL